jgi:hypothetical protein
VNNGEHIFARLEAIEGGCWLWRGYIMPSGYGRVRWNGHKVLVHRAVYEILVGALPPYSGTGKELDHAVCRNRACANPTHIELVAHRINVLRGEGVCAGFARQTACKRGHEFIAANTRVYQGRRYCKPCQRLRQRKAA